MRRISRYKTSSLYLRDSERKREEQQEIEALSAKIIIRALSDVYSITRCANRYMYKKCDKEDVIHDA